MVFEEDRRWSLLFESILSFLAILANHNHEGKQQMSRAINNLLFKKYYLYFQVCSSTMCFSNTSVAVSFRKSASHRQQIWNLPRDDVDDFFLSIGAFRDIFLAQIQGF